MDFCSVSRNKSYIKHNNNKEVLEKYTTSYNFSCTNYKCILVLCRRIFRTKNRKVKDVGLKLITSMHTPPTDFYYFFTPAYFCRINKAFSSFRLSPVISGWFVTIEELLTLLTSTTLEPVCLTLSPSHPVQGEQKFSLVNAKGYCHGDFAVFRSILC